MEIKFQAPSEMYYSYINGTSIEDILVYTCVNKKWSPVKCRVFIFVEFKIKLHCRVLAGIEIEMYLDKSISLAEMNINAFCTLHIETISNYNRKTHDLIYIKYLIVFPNINDGE